MTPHGYISYTQLKLWETSPEKYKRIYIQGEKTPTSREMAFGNMIHEALEKNEATGDPELDMVLSTVPKYNAFEHELKTTLKAGKVDIPILAKIDTYNTDDHSFGEYKTGSGWWTPEKVRKDDQLTFYAMAIYAEHQFIPNKISLIQIRTQWNEKERKVEATGEYKHFRTERTMADILKMGARVRKAWDEISEMVEKELT